MYIYIYATPPSRTYRSTVLAEVADKQTICMCTCMSTM